MIRIQKYIWQYNLVSLEQLVKDLARTVALSDSDSRRASESVRCSLARDDPDAGPGDS